MRCRLRSPRGGCGRTAPGRREPWSNGRPSGGGSGSCVPSGSGRLPGKRRRRICRGPPGRVIPGQVRARSGRARRRRSSLRRRCRAAGGARWRPGFPSGSPGSRRGRSRGPWRCRRGGLRSSGGVVSRPRGGPVGIDYLEASEGGTEESDRTGRDTSRSVRGTGTDRRARHRCAR